MSGDARRLAVAGLAALTLVGAGLVARGFLTPGAMSVTKLPDRAAPAPVPPPDPGTPAGKAAAPPPRVSLRDGRTRELRPADGRILIVHYWATWCPPCADELPGLVTFVREIRKDARLEFLAVSVDDDWKTVDTWLASRGAADLPLALDPRREAATAMGTLKFPETWFLTADGRTITHVVGPLDWTAGETRKKIEEVVALARAKS